MAIRSPNHGACPPTARPPPCAQFSMASPGTVLNATHRALGASLVMANTSSYDGSFMSMPGTVVEGKGCAVGSLSYSGTLTVPAPFFNKDIMPEPLLTLRMLCGGTAGLGIASQLLIVDQVCDVQLPANSSLVPFKASSSAKAACDKVKDVLASVTPFDPGSFSGKAQRPNVSTAASAFAPTNCTASWKATVTTPSKVRRVGGFSRRKHALRQGILARLGEHRQQTSGLTRVRNPHIPPERWNATRRTLQRSSGAGMGSARPPTSTTSASR